MMCERTRAHKSELAALCLACAAALYFFSSTVIPNATRLTHGFIAYYTLAQLAREGQANAHIYDAAWFRAQSARTSHGAADDVFNANPPALAPLWLPLAFFPPDGAFVLMTHVSQMSRTRALLLGAFSLVAAPPAENFRLGQMYVLLLFLFALSLFLWQREQSIAGGIALGSAAILKTAGAFLWLMFLARRETRVLIGGAIALGAGILLSLPMVGAETWRMYLFEMLPAVADNPEQSLTAYQTLTGLLQHLLHYDARLNAFPLRDAPWLARAVYRIGHRCRRNKFV